MRPLAILTLAIGIWSALTLASRADIAPFIGNYTGSAEVTLEDGSSQRRDMSVEIFSTSDGFGVTWASTRLREDGRSKTKSYTITFVPTERAGVFAAAQRRNVFGHKVPLDPMRGEPYVWARLSDSTLSVYSLFVTDDGGYELQQYNRSLVEGGLKLEFSSHADGVPVRSVNTVLERQP